MNQLKPTLSRRGSKASISFCFWLVWAVALLAAPFRLERQGSPLLLDYSYGYLSIGFLIGLIAHNITSAHLKAKDFSLVVLIATAIGLLVFPQTFASTWISTVTTPYVGLLDPSWHQDNPKSLSLWQYYISWLFANPSLTSGLCTVFEGLSCAMLGRHLLTEFSANYTAGHCEDDTTTPGTNNTALALFLILLIGSLWVASIACPLLETKAFAASKSNAGAVSSLSSLATVSVVVLAIKSTVAKLTPDERIDWVVTALVAINAGRLICCAASSCIFNREMLVKAAFLAAGFLLLALIALVLVTFLENSTESSASNCALADDNCRMIEEFLSQYPLTEREKACVKLLIHGNSSEESAAKLGLKAATVRTYLQRSYKKTGVSNSRELTTLVRYHIAKTTRKSDQQTGKPPRIPKKLDLILKANHNRLFLFSLIATVGLLCLPHQFFATYGNWFFEHGIVIGMGLGPAIACCLIFIENRHNPNIVKNQSRYGLSLLLPFLVSFLALFHITFPTSIGASLTSVISFFISTLCSFIMCIYATKRQAFPDNDTDTLASGISSAVLVVMVSFCNKYLWTLGVFLVVVSLFVCIVFNLKQSVPDHISRKTSSRFVFPLFFASMGFGFVLGEQWHAESSMFSFNAQLLFFVSLNISLVIITRAELVTKKTFVTAILISSALISLRVNAIYGLMVFYIAIFLMAFSSYVFSHKTGLEHFLSSGLGLSIGLIPGHLITDFWDSTMALGLGDLSTQSSTQDFVLITPTILILILFIGIGSTIYCMSIFTQDEESVVDLELTKRRLLYLQSQGISFTHSQAIILLSQGYRGNEVAKQLHYSLGTVNTARSNAYKALGVHSIKELEGLLDEVVPYVIDK